MDLEEFMKYLLMMKKRKILIGMNLKKFVAN